MSKLMIFIAPSFLFFTLFCFTLTSLCSDSLGSFYPVYLSVSITGKEEVLAKACNFFFFKKKTCVSLPSERDEQYIHIQRDLS